MTLLCFCRETSPRKEIWRLRMNWMFFLITPLLTGIAVNEQASYHQFIINPTNDAFMKINDTLEVEPGLGLSETFYSWSIAVISIGEVSGALLAGFLVRVVPYWPIVFCSILLHIAGYLLYALATEGWMIIFSRLLHGAFVGAEFTLAPAYFGESYSEYVTVSKELGKEEGKGVKAKDVLNAAHSISMALGTAVGTGSTAIVSLFSIKQFRLVGWTNAAVGVVALLLQFVLFHEHFRCRKDCRRSTDIFKFNTRFKIRWIGLFTISFLLLLKGTRHISYEIYQTLYNPILSDQFGVGEREQSYVFFALVAPQLAGAILIFILQAIGLHNRNIVIIGLLSVLSGGVILTDWQALPYDPCTMYSPFHHPELLKNYTERATDISLSMQFLNNDQAHVIAGETTYYEAWQSDVCFPELHLLDILKFDVNTTTVECSESNSCAQCINGHSSNNTKAYCVTLFHTSEGIVATANSSYIPIQEDLSTYLCSLKNSLYSNCACLITNRDFSSGIKTGDIIHDEFVHPHKRLQEVFGVKAQSWHNIIINKNIYSIAVNECVSQQDTFGCHWIPHSMVTGKLCEDCPPICRSVHHILTFTQFCAGAVLLKMSLPTGRVSAVCLITDVVDKEYMSVIIGMGYAIASTIAIASPPWLVASYEVTQKRTFLVFFIYCSINALFLLGVLILYTKVGEQQSIVKKCTDNKSADASNDTEEGCTEQSKLMPETE